MVRRHITPCVLGLLLLGPAAGVANAQDHPGVEPYNQVCGFCHGPEGRGDAAPPLVPLAYEVDYILAIVREGYGQMPPISTRELKDEQVRRVVEYLEILTRGPQRDQAKKSTAWGDPDLQGTWGASGATPMERPDEYQGRATVSDEEVTQIRQATAESDEKYLHAPAQRAVAGGNVGSYNNFWGEPGARSNRTSMIVDPPDGRFPPLTPAGEFAKNNRPRGDDTWEDRHIWERCVTRGGMPNAMFPRWYNNNIQIFQSPGVVAILLEQVHEVRIVPLDAPPPGVIDDWSVERRVVRALGGRDTGRRNDQSRPPGERPAAMVEVQLAQWVWGGSDSGRAIHPLWR